MPRYALVSTIEGSCHLSPPISPLAQPLNERISYIGYPPISNPKFTLEIKGLSIVKLLTTSFSDTIGFTASVMGEYYETDISKESDNNQLRTIP